MAKRNVIPGIVLRPEAFRLINSNLTWFATRYTIYGDRARQRLLFDDTYTGVSKESFSYSVDMTDDTVIFFTTNIQLSDGSWCGESPLTPVILRKNRVSSSGIISTPEIAVSFIDGTMVVVEQANKFIGKTKQVEIIRSLQTDAGRMMFAKLVDNYHQSPNRQKSINKTTNGRKQVSQNQPSHSKKNDKSNQSAQFSKAAKPSQKKVNNRRPKTSAQHEAELIRLADKQ